jgi:phage tail-like protein
MALKIYSGFGWGVNAEDIGSGDGSGAPTVLSVLALDSGKVRVTFDRDMLVDTELGDTANYVITSGAVTLAVLRVDIVSATQVDLTTSQQESLTYALEILQRVRSSYGVLIGTNLEYFTGVSPGYQTSQTVMYSYFGTPSGIQYVTEEGFLPDVDPPYLDDSYPHPAQINIPIEPTIWFDFRDDYTGIDLSSVEITIYGELVWSGESIQPGWTGGVEVVDPPGAPYAYKYTFNRDAKFPEGVDVTVGYVVKDQATIQNTLSDSWAFHTLVTPPYVWNQNPYPGQTDVSPSTSIVLEIKDSGNGVNANSVILKVLGITCWQYDTEQGPFNVTRTVLSDGFRYVIDPLGILPDWSPVEIEVYAEDLSSPPGVLDTSYIFYTAEQEVEVRCPLGAMYIDRVEIPAVGGTDPDPYICNRTPAPSVPGGVESAQQPFHIPVGSLLKVEVSLVPQRIITGTSNDTITKATRIVHLENGAFTSADEGRTLRIPGCTNGANNRDYTIESYIGPQDVLVGQEPAADEGPANFMGDWWGGIYEDTVYEIEFEAGDFPDMNNVSAQELVDLINAEGFAYLHARITIDGRQVRLEPVNVSDGGLTQFAAPDIRVHSDTLTALGFSTALASTNYDEAERLQPIEFHVISSADDPDFSDLFVYLWLQGVETLIFQAFNGVTSYLATGWSVTQSIIASPGAPNPDVWQVLLEHTTDFVSDARMRCRIVATRQSGAIETEAKHEFFVEDYLRPHVEEIIPWAPKTLRLEFSEPMEQDDTSPTSVLYTRDVSGRVAYYRRYNIGTESSPIWKDNVIEAPVASFVRDEVGMFIGSRGARNALNNGAFVILERISNSLVRVDSTLVDESPADPQTEIQPTLVVSPFRITGVAPSLPTIKPIFCPIVVSAEEADPLTIPPYENDKRFLIVKFDDDLTPSANYLFEIVKVQDERGNEISSTYPFTSWVPATFPGRQWDLWEMLPLVNRDADSSRDLEKFIRCFDEASTVMLADVDRFGLILDPVSTPETVVDVLLKHLGNPLAFVAGLTVQKKRDLIPLLVPMYKKRGTAKGIEDAVEFFTTKSVTVTPWEIPADTWKLGRSYLGMDTYIGPSRSFVRYSFYLDHTASLSTSEQDVITQIVEFMRPAHTHFIGFRLVS